MQLTLQIDLGNGPVQVKTNLMVIVNWERKYKRKASQIAEGGIGMEDLAFMAHEAAKVSGISPLPLMLDDFIKQLVSLEVVDSESPNPTEAAPSDIL
jgi:hypothetical protein